MANGLGMPPGVAHNPYQFGGGGLPQGYGGGGGMPGMIPQLGGFAPFAAPAIQGLFSSVGLIPGQFAGTQNLYDQQRQALLLQQQQAFVQQASQADMPTYINMLRNMGMTNPGNIATAAQGISGMMPMLGQMMPQQIDALHGGMGSATVMAGGMWQGGRFGADPLTGRMGMSPNSLQQYHGGIAASYFQPGGLQAMHGFGMGAAGQMFSEMQQRGYMPEQGFGQGSMPQNTQRIVQKMQGMSGALRAMQDIFGAEGRTGSISELFQGLEQMTQGAAFQMTPARMEGLVRRAHATATTTQVGMDAIMATSAAAAQAGDPLGVRRDISAQAGQFGVVHGAAIRSGGWQGVQGAADESTIRVMRARVAARGANSQIANSQAAILRAVEANPALANGRMGRIAEAIRSGQTTVDGQPLANFLTPGGLSNLLQSEVSSGNMSQDSANLVRENTRDTITNQQYIADNGIMENTARMQGQVDVSRRIFDPAAGRAIVRTLAGAGIGDRRQRRRIAMQLRPIISRAVMDAGPEDIRTPAAFRSYITSKIRGPLARLGISGSKADEMAGNIASRTWADANRRAQRAGYGNATQMVQLFGNQAGGDAAAISAQRNDTQRQQTAMSSITPTGGPIRRLMTALSDPNVGNRDLGEVIGEVLGGIPADAVTDAMRGDQSRLDKLNKDLADPNISADQRKVLMSQRNDVMGRLREGVMSIRRGQGGALAEAHARGEQVDPGKIMTHAAEMSADTKWGEGTTARGRSVQSELAKKQKALQDLARGKRGGLAGLLQQKGEEGDKARELMKGITSDMAAINKGGDALEKQGMSYDAHDVMSGKTPRSGQHARPTGRPETTTAEGEESAQKRDEVAFSIGNLYVKTDGSGSLSLESSSRTS